VRCKSGNGNPATVAVQLPCVAWINITTLNSAGLTCLRQLHSVHRMKTMMQFCTRLITLVTLVTLAAAMSAPLVSAQDLTLYEHSIAVEDDSDQSLIAGRREAMEAVLVKVSGSRDVLASDNVIAAVRDAETYAARYGFQAGSGADAGQLYLWAAFDPAAIDALLAGSGQSQWRGSRPDTLVWLVTDTAGGRVIEGADGDTVLLQSLRQSAADRGLKVLVPLFDLEDQRAISASDLWGNFPDAVSTASARYPAGVVLVGRMQQQDGKWLGNWTVYQGNEQQDWENRAASQEALVASALQFHADRLTSVYAGPATMGAAAGATVLQVSGITSLQDYLRVTAYLQNLGAVASVRPLSMSGDRVEFNLNLGGSAQGLQRVLSLEGVLNALPGSDTGAALPAYQLL